VIRKRIHALLKHLLHEHTAPSRMALAVFVGCVVGCTPLFGLHLFVCIALAFVLRLNQLVVYGAANISIPPFIPFIGFTAVQLGERMLHGHWMSLTLADFTWRNAPSLGKTFFINWLAGGSVLGAGIGAIGGAVTWIALARRRTRRLAAADPIFAAILAASDRYLGLPGKLRMYARMKYRMDPCYRAIAPHCPPGSFTVDLGCGLGMLPVLLGVLGEGRRAHGVEWDAEKARAGTHAARDLDAVTLIEGDARSAEIPACDVITLVDVLHYWDTETQRALVARCRAALRPGGKLLIREADPDRRGGARWTRFIERTVTRLGWNRGPQVRFRPIAELRADLEAQGFTVRTDEVAGQLHPGNVLLIAELP
jgi:uncharacterized protein (DUF2062 family)/precorrin-6B methylase 2